MFVVKIIENSLYTINYENEHDEFSRIFNNWSDVEYLFAFFEKHQSDLQKEFYNYLSIEDAIQHTIDEANKLEEKLISIAENGKTNDLEELENLFKPLDNKEQSVYPIPAYQKSKVYGDEYKSWLRIYAIRIEKNVFIVTGGAIKLVEKMEEREHLKNELLKLDKVKQFLISEGIIDNDGIIEYLELK